MKDKTLYFADKDNNNLCVVDLTDASEVYTGTIIHDVSIYNDTNQLDRVEISLVGEKKYAMYDKINLIVYYLEITDNNTITNYKTVVLYKYQGSLVRIYKDYVVMYDNSQTETTIEIQSVNECKQNTFPFTDIKRVNNLDYLLLIQNNSGGIFILNINDISTGQTDSCCDGNITNYGKTDDCPNKKEEEETTDSSNIILANIALIALLFTLIL